MHQLTNQSIVHNHTTNHMPQTRLGVVLSSTDGYETRNNPNDQQTQSRGPGMATDAIAKYFSVDHTVAVTSRSIPKGCKPLNNVTNLTLL